MGTIVVGMGESVQAAAALRWAVDEGARRGWPVRAVLAWTSLVQHRPDRSDRVEPEYGEADAAEALATYVADALGSDVAGVELDVAFDRPGPALVEASRDASLTVVGSNGHGTISGALLGSVSRYCLHHTTTPVAVVRSDDRSPDRLEAGSDDAVKAGKVVVGIDGSDASRRALDWALDDARSRGGWVEVVHAWSLPPTAGLPVPVLTDLAVFEEAAEAVVAHVLDNADLSGLSRPVSRVIMGGRSAASLLTARGADAELVVVGSRGLGGLPGLLLGSVSDQVVHHSPTTVVVVPA